MPSVDNRVVEMRFNNKEFESGVSTSLNTLEKLKKSLNLEGAANGLEDVDKAAKGISFDGISASLQVVSDHFSAFGITFVTFRRVFLNCGYTPQSSLILFSH